jgi:hypothetical protein
MRYLFVFHGSMRMQVWNLEGSYLIIEKPDHVLIRPSFRQQPPYFPPKYSAFVSRAY